MYLIKIMLVYLTLDYVYVVSNLCLNLEDNDKSYKLHALSLQLSSIFQSSINPQSRGVSVV